MDIYFRTPYFYAKNTYNIPRLLVKSERGCQLSVFSGDDYMTLPKKMDTKNAKKMSTTQNKTICYSESFKLEIIRCIKERFNISDVK